MEEGRQEQCPEPDGGERPSLLAATALCLVAWPFFCALSAVAGLLVGMPVTALHLLTGGAAALAVSRRIGRFPWTLMLRAGAICLAVGFVSAFLASFSIDSTYDANFYHYPAIISLEGGWNPIWQTSPRSADAEWDPRRYAFEVNGEFLPWYEVFPKAQWYLASMWVELLGRLESGNFSHIYYLVAQLLVVWWLTSRVLSRFDRFTVAAVASLHPIALAQWPCAYLDGQLGSLLGIGAFSLWALWRRGDSRAGALVVFALAVAANLKFTGAVYVAVLFGAFVPFLWRSPLFRRVALAVGVAALAIGIQPYVTNTIRYGSPIYPVVSLDPDRESFNVMVGQIPPYFAGMSGPRRILESHLLCDPAGWAEAAGDVTWWRRWHWGDGIGIYWIDLRVGGFGAWFRLGLLGAFILALCVSRDGAAWLAAGALALSVFPNWHGWWARLAPQLAVVPSLLLLGVLSGRGKWGAWFARIVAWLLVANALAIGWQTTLGMAKETREELDRMIHFAEAGPQGVPASVFGRAKAIFYLAEKFRLEKRLDVRMQPDAASLRPDLPVSQHTFAQVPESWRVDVAAFLERWGESDSFLIAADGDALRKSAPLVDWFRARGCELPPEGEGLAAVFKRGALTHRASGRSAELKRVRAAKRRANLVASPQFGVYRIEVDKTQYSIGSSGINLVAADRNSRRVRSVAFLPGEERGGVWVLPFRRIGWFERLRMLWGCYSPARKTDAADAPGADQTRHGSPASPNSP